MPQIRRAPGSGRVDSGPSCQTPPDFRRSRRRRCRSTSLAPNPLVHVDPLLDERVLLRRVHTDALQPKHWGARALPAGVRFADPIAARLLGTEHAIRTTPRRPRIHRGRRLRRHRSLREAARCRLHPRPPPHAGDPSAAYPPRSRLSGRQPSAVEKATYSARQASLRSRPARCERQCNSLTRVAPCYDGVEQFQRAAPRTVGCTTAQRRAAWTMAHGRQSRDHQER
jgi:hypothetical protein